MLLFNRNSLQELLDEWAIYEWGNGYIPTKGKIRPGSTNKTCCIVSSS